MSRQWLAVLSGLVVGSSIAAVAWSQTTTRQPTLAERMSSLRRGWLGGNDEQADSDSAAPPSATSNNGLPQLNGRALLPGNFSPNRSRQTVAPSAQAPADSAGGSRYSTTPRAGSARADQTGAQRFTLPGLGGSRLPSADSTQPTPRLAPSDDITPIGSGRYSSNQPPQSGRADSDFGTASTRVAQQGTSPVRQSPQRRPTMHMDPNDLSRELVGSFSTPSNARSEQAAAPQAATSSTPASMQSNTPLSLPASSPEPTLADENGVAASETSSSSGFRMGEPAETNAPAPGSASARPSAKSGMVISQSAPTPAQPVRTTPSAPSLARNREMFGGPASSFSSDPTVLVTQQTPTITTDIRGPRQILVGREATFRVQLANQGNAPAEGLVASIRIPAWADVIDTAASHGTIQQSQNGATIGVLEWQIARLEGHAHETLDLRIVPRNSRPLELGVSWSVAPVGSRAVVEVQEPKLGISVTGPDEVLYGKPQLFRLTINNPGTGTTENVKIDLLPPGGGDGAVSSTPLGDLPAGASKVIEVELTAREAGKLAVKAHASAEGGLEAEGEKEIFCRKPELEVDWRGPEEKYAGTPATYFFRVRNPGTAPAEDVTVRVSLPEGAEYAGGSDGQSYDAQRREVTWQVGMLAPGDDYYMELRCMMNSPGANQLKIVAATAAGGLTDNKLAETKVIALADLKLEVSDPSGPVAVGEEALYEIRVKNRGANTAEDVNIVALFSEGIEPDQAEGALYTVADGRVSFRTIEELPAGRQVTLRVRAHAVQAGTHVFRAEVLCKDLEIKLAAEETTRFYADDLQADTSSLQQSAGRSQFDDSSLR